MNQSHYTNANFQSDQDTVTPAQTIQQPIVTLEYLLNQNKMKEIALTKATHLIELYKIQLQVKQQDYLKEIENVTQSQKENYEALVSELQDKIVQLEKQLKAYQLKIKDLQKRPSQQFEIEKLNESGCRIPRISRNNSGKDLSNNRKARYSHGKNISNSQQNSMRRSISNINCQQATKEVDLYRIEKTFLIQYILKCEEKDQKILHSLENELNFDAQMFAELKSSIKSNEKFIEQFLRQLKQPAIEMENKLKEYRQVIKIQELIIEELNGQLTEYQDLFNVMNSSLEEIYSKDNEPTTFDEMRFSIMTSANSFSKSQHSFEQFRQTIDECQQNTISKLKQHKSFIKQKILNMEGENKELKRIMDDMIKLIKNNKKMQIGTFGSIKSTKNSEETIDPMKEKSKSHMMYRK